MKIKLPKKAVVPEGFTVEYHEEMSSFDPTKLSLHLEPEQETGYISGHVLRERMKGKGLNINVANYLVKHPELIPKEWKGKFVSFWGTIVRNRDGTLLVPYVYDRGDRAVVRWDWLGGDWDGRHPAARFASLPSEPSEMTISTPVPIGPRPTSASEEIEIINKKLDVLLNHFGLNKFVK
jgi:hypothetical protein